MKSQKESCIYLAQNNQGSGTRKTEPSERNVSQPKTIKKIHRVLVWLLLLSMSIGLSSPKKVDAQADIRLGTLIIAVSSGSPPFAARAKNGRLVGFDLDIIQKLVRTAGLRVTYENAPFSQLIPGVSTHLYDAAISCIFVNDKRRSLINFSNTYFTTGTLLVVHKANETIHTLADLNANVVATVSEGSTAEKFIREQTESQVLLASSLDETLENVNSGNAQVALTDEISAKRYIKNHSESNLKIVGGLITNEQCAIAVNKDNIQLLIELNAALTRLKNNGQFLTIYQRWFGSRPPEGPKPLTQKKTVLPTDDEPQNDILVDNVSGLYEAIVQTDPPTYQTIELSSDGHWQETVLTDVASRIQSGVPPEEAALPQQQVGQWQIVVENSVATEIEIQAIVPLAELSVPSVASADITGGKAVTRLVSTPIRKEYSIIIEPDGTMRGSYKLYAHQTTISERVASENETDKSKISTPSENQIDGTEIASEVVMEIVEFTAQRIHQ